MVGKQFILTLLALVTLAACTRAAWAAPDELARTATWKMPSADDVRGEVLKWFESQTPDATIRQKFKTHWPADEPVGQRDLLLKTAQAIAIAEPRAQSLVDWASRDLTLGELPDTTWLAAETITPLVRNNLRLVGARALMQQQFYDEALPLLEGLQPADVVDPASLLFVRSVVHHRLLKKEPGLESLDLLLERSDELPRRYSELAQLMRSDLEKLEDDSLDHISRMMDDVQRRLDLGRANKKVRKVEDDVIEALDKMIKKMEDQQKKQQQQQAQMQPSQGSNRNVNPAKDSMLPAGPLGKGDVTKRRLGRPDDWGDMPAKEREETIQEIGRDFPPHYREVIKEYFREMAKRKQQK